MKEFDCCFLMVALIWPFLGNYGHIEAFYQRNLPLHHAKSQVQRPIKTSTKYTPPSGMIRSQQGVSIVCHEGMGSGMGFGSMGLGPEEELSGASLSSSSSSRQRKKGAGPKRLPNLQDLDPAMLNRLDPEGLAESPLQPITPEVSERFRLLVEDMLVCEDVTELGPILVPEVEFLLTHNATQLMNDLQAGMDDEKEIEVLDYVFDFIYQFLEDIVNQTIQVQKKHQRSLREILEAAKQGEDQLDNKISLLGKDLDLGFLDYLDVEIERLSKEDDVPMVPILATIRARVCTEIEQGLGTEVAFLSKIVQYDDEEYRELCLQNFVGSSEQRTIQNFQKLVTATMEDMEKRQITGDGLLFRLKHIKKTLEDII
mmetsp:Transcript_36/g.35  ORF Transcript_36/g.35 Transcript_36/m.35 type:complete len:370 (+) Transcript_36:56-1165(+)